MNPRIAKAAREIALQTMPDSERLQWMETNNEPTDVPSSHARAMFYWAAARIEDAEPRCDTCKHWKPNGDHKDGDCVAFNDNKNKLRPFSNSDDGAGLETDADFGCVQWEAK